MAVSKPELSVGRTGGSNRVNFTVETSVDWSKVPAGDIWVAYVLIIERDGRTDSFDVRADGSVSWDFKEGADDWVVWVPIQLERPAGNGVEKYKWDWSKSENSVGAEIGKEEFKSRVWLVPDSVPRRFASDWSHEVSIGL